MGLRRILQIEVEVVGVDWTVKLNAVLSKVQLPRCEETDSIAKPHDADGRTTDAVVLAAERMKRSSQ